MLETRTILDDFKAAGKNSNEPKYERADKSAICEYIGGKAKKTGNEIRKLFNFRSSFYGHIKFSV